MKTLLVSVFLLSCSSFLVSQTNSQYIGTAQGSDIEAVREAALRNLSQQIQVFIASKSTRRIREDNNAVSDSLYSSTVTQSVLSLTDVKETLEKIDSRTVKITKSVSRASVQKMFEQRRKKILDFLAAAEQILREPSPSVPLQQALDNYFQAYLLAMIYPDTLTFYFSSQQASLEVGIPNAVATLARSIEFIPLKQIDDDFIVWKYTVTYNGKPVSHLRYSYFDGMGQSDDLVQNGQTSITLFYNAKTEKEERQLQAQIEYPTADQLDNTLSLAKKFINTSVLHKTFSILVPGEKKEIMPNAALPKSLQDLLNARNSFEEVRNEIDRLVKNRSIVQGRANDFETLNGLFCIVVDRAGLLALIKNTNNLYFDYLSNKNVELKQFAGKRILWFEVLK